jgi:hypothetical protein
MEASLLEQYQKMEMVRGDKCLTVKTKKYSSFFSELIGKYEDKTGVYAKIDGVKWESANFSELSRVWIFNRIIKNTHDFKLIDNGKVVCAFHDEPCDIFCSMEELSLVKSLATRKVLRYELSKIA